MSEEALTQPAPEPPELRFELEWLTGGEPGDSESSSYGALSMSMGDDVLTFVEDTLARTTRRTIRVSLSRLAMWFAANWWRLRWEPAPGTPSLGWRMAHEMGAIGGGFVWPQISFASDGEELLITQRASHRQHTIRYLSDHVLSCGASAFERGVDDFVDQVLARQSSCRAMDVDLQELWSAVRSERADQSLATFRRREAMMGLDPGEVSADVLARLFERGEWIGPSALDETLVNLDAASADRALTRLDALRGERSLELSSKAIGEAVARWTPTKGTHSSRLATGLAAHLRQYWQLGAGPVTDAFLEDVLEGDIHSDRMAIAGAPPFVAFREDASIRPVLRRTHFPANRRFDIARLIADTCIADPADALSPLTRSHTARQKFQRIAAQELLCPVAAIAQRLSLPQPDDEELAQVAQYFGVSELLVTTALVHRGLVPRDYLARAAA